MNKDLDDRLVPNGEYRDAQNISVGKSEDDDIGALETILGNQVIQKTLLGIPPVSANAMKIIGYITDEYNDSVYAFATNYTDGEDYNTAPVRPSASLRCIIYSWSSKTPNAITILVDDVFLNFSTTNPIQATLIEEMLFFTDNRNQPRKISTDKPVGHYTSEDQISVAKYNPYEPISLIKKQTATVLTAPSTSSLTINANTKITVGMSVVSTTKAGASKIIGSEYITVSAVNVAGTLITLSKAPATTILATDIFTFLESTMTNKSGLATWPGDPDYLENKFVRFSYRFRFEDGEYSIMAPFTQIAYIPKQKGYFLSGNEDAAYRSTILDWMENNVDNVDLLISLPDLANKLSTSYKITSMDILYKESDALVVKVLETLTSTDIISSSTENICSYSYQSRKPYKTLTQAQTVRVYDKVPVRALSQETSGNRIIYGNFRDVYTPPNTLPYTVTSTDKNTVLQDNWIEYPNHSLKQNRNYQVGFVLADKFGRQSSVILSPVTSDPALWSAGALGSTIFAAYNSTPSDIKSWFGDALQVTVNEPGITSNFAANSQPNFSTGEPGLYAVRTGIGWAVDPNVATSIANNVYTFSLTGTANTVVPVAGDFLRGEYIDYVEVITVTNTGSAYNIVTGLNGDADTSAVVNSMYQNNYSNDPDLKYAYSINVTGWYSYKIVVKQTEQDYYNVYLPGILKGYPLISTTLSGPPAVPFPTDPLGSTSNIVLINDNINKVPRDLAEVGPDQKQFRSSVQLFPRVENTLVASTPATANDPKNNIQYYPGTSTDTAISIATTNDSNMDFLNLSPDGQANIYQIDSKPLVARLATSTSIGVVSSATTNINMKPFLAIYETEPVESLLDIYWETTSVGMISDLNTDVSTGFDGPTSFQPFNFTLSEDDAPGTVVTDFVYPVSQEGSVFDTSNPTQPITSGFVVKDGNNTTVTNQFFLEYDNTINSPTRYAYRIKTMAASLGADATGNSGSNTYFTYLNNSSSVNRYTFSITVKPIAAPEDQNVISAQTTLLNVNPVFSPALALITKTVDEEVIGTLSAFNGTNLSNLPAQKILQLQWSITDQRNASNAVVSYFSIDPSNGDLTQVANTTPNGLYSLTITLQDCVVGGSQANPGGKTITGLQLVRIGPTPANDEIKSLQCVSGPVDATALRNSVILITNFVTATVTGVWYLSATALAAGYTSGTVNSDLPIAPSAANSTTNTLFRLGTGALTQGQIVFSLNAGMVWANTPPFAGLQGALTWKIWHRATASSAWAHISDINNQPVSVPSIPVVINTASIGTFDDFYNQVVVAFDKTGEYCIAAIDAETQTANQQSQALTCWVNSNDLNYSTCVIENGVNITGGTARSYEYGISTSGTSGFNCLYGFNSAYSNIPYGSYVPQFFTTDSLTTPYTFPESSLGSGISNYHSFKTAGTSPYDDPSSYRYSFSTRFTTADAKVYIPSPWTQCYIQNCGNTNVATTTCAPLQMQFPY